VTDTIHIAVGLLGEIVGRARLAAPRECCGLLVGTRSRVDECVATANVDPHPSRYQVDPAAHIALNRRLRGSGRAIVGVYHSHPRGGGDPSPTDVAEALYPDFIHLIVSAVFDDTPEIRAFRISEGKVHRLGLEEDAGGESS
jgi:proteasome lid subunit RPN8/RPN11